MSEQWKEVSGFSGRYAVSDLGRVRVLRHTYKSAWPVGHVLSPHTDPNGYLSVCLYSKSKARRIAIHTIVLTAFVGVRPEGQECRHRDGNKTNNRLGNLSWATHRENEADKLRHGTQSKGEQNGAAKLSERQVVEIRGRYDAGERHRSIAASFGVHRALISQIGRRVIWRHIQ